MIEHRIRRVNWSLIGDAIMGTFNADRGFFFTLRAFLLNPRAGFEDYLGGNRMHYVNPLKLVIFLSAIAAFAMHHLLANEVIQTGGSAAQSSEQEARVAFTRRNYNLLLLCSLPFMAVVSWLFYWRRAYNWLEHLALNAFQVSIITVAYFFVLPAIVLWPAIANFTYLFFALSYQAWFYRKILGPNWLLAIVATLTVTVVYLTTMSLMGFWLRNFTS